MNLVLFIDNHSMSDVDITRIKNGNPGIGGTQFEMFSLARLLIENNTTYNFVLVLTHKQLGMDYINTVILDKFNDIFDYCNKNDVDILISRENNKFNLINSLIKTKVIFWIHNYVSYDLIKEIGKTDKIKRVIFVSKQHYDFYLEYNINQKATYIFNGLAINNQLPIISNKENNVVFTGNLVPIKRLHLVTKIWPRVVKKVPDAKLFVIGNGASAHRDARLGPNNIAEENYEKIILKPLIKSNCLDTVKFLGILGNEKNDIIQSAKIGVSPNKDETFCLCAAEYILNGVPVIGVKKGGIIDVVTNGRTGYLHRSLRMISKDIICFLKGKKRLIINENDIEEMKNKFGFNAFYESWIKNIEEVFTGTKVKTLKSSKPRIDKAKWFGIFCKNMRTLFHLPEWFSRLGFYKIIKRTRK